MKYRIVEHSNKKIFNVQELVENKWSNIGKTYIDKKSAESFIDDLLDQENIVIHEYNGRNTNNKNIRTLFD